MDKKFALKLANELLTQADNVTIKENNDGFEVTLDLEGHEGTVLTGLFDILSNYPDLFCEMNECSELTISTKEA